MLSWNAAASFRAIAECLGEAVSSVGPNKRPSRSLLFFGGISYPLEPSHVFSLCYAFTRVHAHR